MRIGIDVRALMEGKRTGVETYVVNLLENIFALDRENEYILFANNFPAFPASLPKFPHSNVRYQVFRYPNKLFNISQITLRQPRLDRLLGDLDLFFSPHWRALALDPALPLVVTFHDLSFEVLPEFFTLRRQIWHRLMGYRAAAKRAQRIIAPSHSTKADLVHYYGLPPEKIEVIYSGVQPSSSGAPVTLPPSYFLFFGTFEPRKNLNSLLVAYAAYLKQSRKPLPLVLAGSAGWKSTLYLPKSLLGHVRILQNPSEEEKAEIYRRAYAFLFLSLYEGFGFPILEAACAGAPVITSAVSSLAEIGQEFALLVNPLRPRQIANAMLLLENDPDLYRDLKRAGLIAAKRFSWRSCAEQTLEVFRSMNQNKGA